MHDAERERARDANETKSNNGNNLRIKRRQTWCSHFGELAFRSTTTGAKETETERVGE